MKRFGTQNHPIRLSAAIELLTNSKFIRPVRNRTEFLIWAHCTLPAALVQWGNSPCVLIALYGITTDGASLYTETVSGLTIAKTAQNHPMPTLSN